MADFAESEVLKAVLAGEYSRAATILKDFFPYELDVFERQTDHMLGMIRQTIRNKRGISEQGPTKSVR